MSREISDREWLAAYESWRGTLAEQLQEVLKAKSLDEARRELETLALMVEQGPILIDPVKFEPWLKKHLAKKN
jgi:hypothetical protein